MKNLFLTLLFLIPLHLLEAQQSINISGKIVSLSSAEPIYLGIDNVLSPLNLSNDGTFSIDGSIQQFPSFFYFANISKKGKIEHQTPLVWFEADSIVVTVDWSDKSFRMQSAMPFQSTSEKIEALDGKKQVEFILDNPTGIPGIYFINEHKEDISISDLEVFSKGIAEANRSSVYSKRIESHLSAKKRKPLKKGNKIEDFKLPDEDGNQVSVIKGENKTQVIALFSSGCSYSIASIDLLEQLAKSNNDKIEITTIWEDQNRDTWLNLRKDQKSKITWDNLWDEFGFASTYLNRTMWPTFYVVNSDGELTDIMKGYTEKTAKKLKALLD